MGYYSARLMARGLAQPCRVLSGAVEHRARLEWFVDSSHGGLPCPVSVVITGCERMEILDQAGKLNEYWRHSTAVTFPLFRMFLSP
jgi:hypothetical protein